MPPPAKPLLTTNEAIGDLRRWADAHGRIPKSSDYMGAKNGDERETYDRVRAAFGSWPDAIRAAFGPDAIPGESLNGARPEPSVPTPGRDDERDESVDHDGTLTAVAARVEEAKLHVEAAEDELRAAEAEFWQHPLVRELDDRRS